MTRVSVVVPSYNQHQFLGETLAALFAQTWEDLEILVMDGGSSDGSLEVLRDYNRFTSPKRYHWRSEPDGGQALAINQGMEQVTGEIVAWLNSDDLLDRRAVEQAVSYFDAHPETQVVYGQGVWINEQGKRTGKYPTASEGIAERELFADGCFICQPSVFLRHTAWNELGGLDSRFETAIDFDLWLRAFKRFPQKIAYVPEIIAYSRYYPTTKTEAKRDLVFRESIELVHREFGAVPIHWVLTYVAELLPRMFDDTAVTKGSIFDFLAWAVPKVRPEDRSSLMQKLKKDCRFNFLQQGALIETYTDGWSMRNSRVRLFPKARDKDATRFVIKGLCNRPDHKNQMVTLKLGQSVLAHKEVQPGNFSWAIELSPDQAHAKDLCLTCEPSFIPARDKLGEALDDRELGVLIKTCQFVEKNR